MIFNMLIRNTSVHTVVLVNIARGLRKIGLYLVVVSSHGMCIETPTLSIYVDSRRLIGYKKLTDPVDTWPTHGRINNHLHMVAGFNWCMCASIVYPMLFSKYIDLSIPPMRYLIDTLQTPITINC